MKYIFRVLFVLVSVSGYAQETTNETIEGKIHTTDGKPAEVVVTGTRTARLLKDTPVLTKVISGVEIEQSGAVTALEALEDFVPGVMFTPNTMGDNINIAGLDNKYILILVDGERLVNERTENVNFSRLNTSDIKQIEVINGASSVLYGSNAIGAVINIITKEVDKPLQGSARVRYSNYNTWVGDASFGLKANGFSSKTNLSAKNSDGYDSGRAGVASDFSMSPYSDYTISEALKYRFNDDFDMELKGNYYRNETWFLHKYQTRIDNNYTFGGKLNYRFSRKNTLTFSGNSDTYRGNQVYKRANDSTVYANGSQYATFRLLDVWDANRNIQLVSGAELNREKTYSENQFGNIPKECEANNRNLFSQGEFKTETGLEALAGVRYTHHSEFGGYLSPKISLMYKLDKLRFRANISNGYKAPTIKEMYMEFPHAIGGDVPFWVIGNPGLVPEVSWYKAVSAEYISTDINASVTIHDNSIQDKIVSEQSWNALQNRTELIYRNVEDAQITGVDVSVQWSFLKYFRLRGGYSFAHAIDKATGWQLPGNSKHNANCNLVFKQSRLPFLSSAAYWPYSLLLSGRYMSSRVLSRNEEEIRSGDYFVTNVVYNQQFPIHNNLAGNFQFGINNLLNYTNHDSAPGNPGRTCFVSLGMKF
ncbi:MAG: TonB-dependent receptor [Tannerella sp.]|jgi:outer membrane receptor for ferrienterochelin and colicins|nr:TonB-dependent receptor [Tannerella sp.]